MKKLPNTVELLKRQYRNDIHVTVHTLTDNLNKKTQTNNTPKRNNKKSKKDMM